MVNEFQAIVLAGYGQRLYHLVDDVPKPLLTIANKAMISYVLQWLDNAGISNITIVATPEAGPKLSHYLTKIYERHTSSARVEIVMPEAYGTADALRAVKDKIKTDFIVVGCDLLTDIPLSRMIEVFRLRGPSVVALFSETPKFEYVGIGGKEIDPVLFVGLDERNTRLTFLKSKEVDYDDPYNNISIPMPVLNEFGAMNIYSAVTDSHCYVFKHWVLDFLVAQKDLSSIREDLLPLLVKCQFSADIRQREGIEKFVTTDLLDMSSYESLKTMNSLTDSMKQHKISAGTSKSDLVNKCRISCYALVNCQTPTNLSYCIRVNTVPAFVEMNRAMTKSIEERISSTAIIEKSTIGTDSVVGYGSKVGERSAIKRSVLGSHCVIGKNVKIANCVILDYVVIEDNVKLENCIICTRACVKEKCSLRDCEVGAKYVVDPSTNAKGEHFLESRTMSADEDGF